MQDRRLYLDTADLIRIGDGQVQPNVIEELLAACSEAGVVLVVSGWHLADLRAAPQDAAGRVVAAVDTFPMRGLVALDDRGAVVQPIDRFQEFVDGGASLLPTLNAVVDLAGSLDREVDAETKRQPPTAVPERIRNLASKLMHEVIAMDAGDVEEHARAFLHKHRREVPPEQAELVVRGMVAMMPMFQSVRAAGVWDDNIVSAVLRPKAPLAEDAHVGRRLGLLVDQRRRAQRDRAIQNGDVPDRHHVEFAPYVDVFTGDRDICAWLPEWQKQFGFERGVRVFGTGRLPDVTAAIRTFGRAPA